MNDEDKKTMLLCDRCFHDILLDDKYIKWVTNVNGNQVAEYYCFECFKRAFHGSLSCSSRLEDLSS